MVGNVDQKSEKNIVGANLSRPRGRNGRQTTFRRKWFCYDASVKKTTVDRLLWFSRMDSESQTLQGIVQTYV